MYCLVEMGKIPYYFCQMKTVILVKKIFLYYKIYIIHIIGLSVNMYSLYFYQNHFNVIV